MRLIFTTGDTNGIGIEVLVKALVKSEMQELLQEHELTFCGNAETFKEYAVKAKLPAIFKNDGFSIGDVFLKMLECENYAPVEFGHETKRAAQLAVESLEKAARATVLKEFDAVITLPISKHALQSVGWNFPGQTEMMAHAAGAQNPMMILCSGRLRVALATVHIPLKNVAASLFKEKIVEKISALFKTLKADFSTSNPKIAVLGLNPHAGESGGIGSEEIDIIQPAIAEAFKNGIDVDGPHPADGFFAHGAFKNYDGVLAMYHDQGLIPLKLIAGGAGVNVTAGLPIVRTSPDHGTAYGIAGKDVAKGTSTAEAIQLAIEIVESRERFLKEMQPNF
ncbi:MAG TPA: 4-hydroxythreonine-4-phosphate dehydrogenase PdxA [Patescibacteria group bacterium]|nr:4-hydroxythreonine-4-phosphate dehydrogenase PdxA [Patescibacteria group bacterium]